MSSGLRIRVNLGHYFRAVHARFNSNARDPILLDNAELEDFKPCSKNFKQNSAFSTESNALVSDIAVKNGATTCSTADPIKNGLQKSEPQQHWRAPTPVTHKGTYRGSRMTGRFVIITGGTSGIGRAVAQRCVQEGAELVVIVSRSLHSANEAIREIKENTRMANAPLEAVEYKIDPADGRYQMPFPESSPIPNPCNTLINCAGTSQSSLLISTSKQDMQDIIFTNQVLRTMVHWHYARVRFQKGGWVETPTNAHLLPDLKTATLTSNCIVNVSSLLAVKGGVGATTYAASKAALTAFSRSLVAELGEQYVGQRRMGPPFRINTVVPGLIETPMLTNALGSASLKTLQRDIPLKRVGQPEEVADAIIFLCSNEYANNCVLNLDGGLSAL